MIGKETDSGSGVFITFEGGEGAGKTTHITCLATALRREGREVVVLREPGGTSIGEALRRVVLDAANCEMSDQAELLIYEAARAQLVREVIAPALAAGKTVLCDRFSDSTIAYQGYGRGLPLEFIQRADDFACQGIHPRRTILLTADAPAETGLERATHHSDADRLEQAGIAFHTAVNQAFLSIARNEPQRVRLVSSATPKEETARNIFSQVADLFGWDSVDEAFLSEYFEELERTKADEKASIVGMA